MATVKAVKKERTTAKRLFTRTKNGLQNALDKQDDLEIIENRFIDLKDKFNKVQEKHEAYISFVDNVGDEFEEEEDEWINDIESTFEDMERRKVALVRTQKGLEEQKKAAEVENLNQLIDSEYGKKNPALHVIEEAQADLKKQFERCKEAHRQLITIIDISNADREIEWIKRIQKVYSDVSFKIVSIRQIHKKDKNVDSLTSSERETCRGHGIRLESMKMPVFDGDIRDYPRFKSDFVKQVVPEMKSKDSMAYALRSCLTKLPLNIVKNVDDDLDEMWKRLDEKYGRTSKLADVVMFDIKRLRVVKEGDDRRFIELVETVEKGYRDLLRVGIEREISNTSTVSIIEEKLPRDIRREWSREVNKANSKVEESNKFPYLLEFLLEQKQIIEYKSMSFRAGATTVRGYANYIGENDENNVVGNHDKMTQQRQRFQCWIDSTNRHTIDDCKVYLGKQPEDRVKILRENRACFSCLRIGHRSSDCEYRKQCDLEECTMYHHQSLHEAHVAGAIFHSVAAHSKSSRITENNDICYSQCLLPLMVIMSDTIPSKEISVLWDSGATFSLITFEKAKQLNLSGKKIDISVIKVGGKRETISSYEYDLPLISQNGESVTFKVYGIDKISTDIKHVSTKCVLHFFNNVKEADI
eukprot:gene21205-23287_t